MTKPALTIVGAQINTLVGDIRGNAERVIEEAKTAIKKHKADIVMFPELTIAGYPPEDLLFRPGFYRRCKDALQMIIDAKLKTTLIVGYPDRHAGLFYNKAAVIQNGKLIATYAKQDLPNYAVFDEKRYFTAGNESCIFTLNGVKVGLVICEDLWGTAPAQQLAKAGAQIILSINASPYDRKKVRAREKMLCQRVTDTNCPIIYLNQVGGQDELVFDGGSMVVNRACKRVQQAAYFAEDMMVVEVDQNGDVKEHELPQRLSEDDTLYQALCLGVKDYIKKNHFPGAVVGLSGGIDSALTLAVAADAVGSENVHAILMPSRYTSQMSIDDAIIQAERMQVSYDIIDIEPIFTAYLTSLAPIFEGLQPDTTEENIQARIRGMLLMAYSNKKGAIVLTTGNKSEMSVGYATLYGDMAGGFAVLKDIPKTRVYELSEYRNLTSSVIPQRVIERAPSAELAEDQKDQDNLPPYPILDQILEMYIEQDMDPHDIIAAGLDIDTVMKVVTLVNQNEYKRRQAPVGIRTTLRAFGKDRRYPITSGYTRNL